MSIPRLRTGICWLVLALVPAVAAQESAGTQITGSVRAVDGTTITIALPPGLRPRVGDAVKLHQEIPGVGQTPVRGEWEVIDVGLDSAIAAADGDAAKPQPGQQATIDSRSPRSPEQLRADLALLVGADEGNTANAETALSQGADINVRAEGGSTPLMRAATQGHTDMLRFLLEAGANPSLEARGGQTALGVAAAQGHSGAISLLLEAGIAIDIPIMSTHASADMRGSTPLMLAARFGHSGAVRRLLLGGADPRIQNAQGDTALMVAAQRGHTDAAAALLEGGADPNARRPDGLTPLIAAAGDGDTTLIRMLIAHGGELDYGLPDSVPEPYGGMTPLLIAAFSGHADAVAALLAEGADPDATNLAGNDGLTLATNAGHDAAAAVLRDPQGAIAASSAQLDAQLLEAAEQASPEDVQRFLLAGARADARTEQDGATPLMLAASENATGVIEMLLTHGADVNATARGSDEGEGAGFTALMVAAMYGHRATVEALLAAGARTSSATPDGHTAASLARDQGHEEVARMIESGG